MSEETLRNIFARNLRHYLEERGHNQSDLCKYMGVSSATASDWCNGRKMPRADKIQSMANWLNVSIGELMDEKSKDESTDYYLNEETAKAAQEIFENKELRLLFDTARDAKPEDIQTVHSMLLALKRKERGNDDTGC